MQIKKKMAEVRATVHKKFDAKAKLTEISVNNMIGLRNISMTTT